MCRTILGNLYRIIQTHKVRIYWSFDKLIKINDTWNLRKRCHSFVYAPKPIHQLWPLSFDSSLINTPIANLPV